MRVEKAPRALRCKGIAYCLALNYILPGADRVTNLHDKASSSERVSVGVVRVRLQLCGTQLHATARLTGT
jgi:hypothetical protein